MKNHLFSKLGVPFEVIEKLFSMGVHTAEDFLKKAKTKKRRVMLSQLLHIPESKIAEWVNRLDFLRLDNMTHEMSEMLHKMGFGSIASLRKISGEGLHKAMNIFNLKNNHVEPHLIPTLEEVKNWVGLAEEKKLKIFGFQMPEIQEKLEEKPKPKLKNNFNYKKILLIISGFILCLLLLILVFKNIKIFLGLFGFISLFLGIYLRTAKDPLPKIRKKIQDFIEDMSERCKKNNKKISFKLDEINRKFHFYRKNLGTFLILFPLILGSLYLLSFSFKMPNLDMSKYFVQKQNNIEKIIGFKDIDSENKYFEAISYLNKKGLIEGYRDKTFRPENPINRAELMKIIVSSLEDFDVEKTKYLKNCFPDVNDEWFADFVCYAEDHSWIHGYDDDTFRPKNLVTRAESLKMILNVFEINNIKSVTEDVYPDVKTYDWFAPFIAYAKESGIIKLDKTENFEPHKSITRGEVVNYIYRVIKKIEK